MLDLQQLQQCSLCMGSAGAGLCPLGSHGGSNRRNIPLKVMLARRTGLGGMQGDRGKQASCAG